MLRDLDLKVAEGSVLALPRPNGAGKTTTIQILSTLTRPDGGSARISGHDVVREAAAVRGVISTGQSYVDYVVPGVIVLCTGYGATSTAMSVADDMKKGVIDRFRSMPVSSFAVLTGHVTASVSRNAVATLAVVLMGFRPSASFVDRVLAMGLPLIYVLALSWLAAAFGVIARSVESASLLGFFMLFIPYLISAFVPVETMPAVLRVVSEHQPITPIIETVRGLLVGVPSSSGRLALTWAGGLLVVSFLLSTWLFRRISSR